MDGVSLELMLLDWDRVTKNEVCLMVVNDISNEIAHNLNFQILYVHQVIGRLELGGARCTGTTLNHWNEVCNSPRRQIAEWHKLTE